MVVLCPKCYVSYNKEYVDLETMEVVQELNVIAMKMKGVCKGQNPHISPGCYLDIIDNGNLTE